MTRAVRALVGAQVVSSLGSLMTAVALPWFVLETTGSATRMSVVLAAESAPLLLLGVPSARLVARHGPWRALVACDAVWVVTTAAIPLLHLLGALSFPLLVALAFLSGVPWAASLGSQSAMVSGLLGDDVRQVAGANAVLQTLHPAHVLRRAGDRWRRARHARRAGGAVARRGLVPRVPAHRRPSSSRPSGPARASPAPAAGMPGGGSCAATAGCAPSPPPTRSARARSRR